MKQEYIVILIIGFLILSYVLDAVVNPLQLNLTSPYHFFDPELLAKYPFTTFSIFLKATAAFMTPILILSYLGLNKLINGSILIVLSGLMQLYALQDVVSGSQIIPLEWSLALALAGVILLIPAIIYLIIGFAKKTHQAVIADNYAVPDKDDEDD